MKFYCLGVIEVSCTIFILTISRKKLFFFFKKKEQNLSNKNINVVGLACKILLD